MPRRKNLGTQHSPCADYEGNIRLPHLRTKYLHLRQGADDQELDVAQLPTRHPIVHLHPREPDGIYKLSA
jgi:hypothetical protein